MVIETKFNVGDKVRCTLLDERVELRIEDIEITVTRAGKVFKSYGLSHPYPPLDFYPGRVGESQLMLIEGVQDGH